MTKHYLKVWPQEFRGLLDGSRTAHVARAHATHKVGDKLVLREWDPCSSHTTGREEVRYVSHVESLNAVGVPTHRMLSFAPGAHQEEATDG